MRIGKRMGGSARDGAGAAARFLSGHHGAWTLTDEWDSEANQVEGLPTSSSASTASQGLSSAFRILRGVAESLDESLQEAGRNFDDLLALPRHA